MSSIWRVTPGQTLHHRDWGDESVLYDNLSGDTHLLEASALQVLLALRTCAASESALRATLCAALELDDEEASHIPALLEDLRGLRLIEEVPC